MKFKIGQNVICKPNERMEGYYLRKQEFLATIVDIVKDQYVTEDQDGDLITVLENEIELNNRN